MDWSGHVHVMSTPQLELISAPLGRRSPGQVVVSVDVVGRVGSAGESLVALVTFVLGVLVLGFAQKQRV